MSNRLEIILTSKNLTQAGFDQATRGVKGFVAEVNGMGKSLLAVGSAMGAASALSIAGFARMAGQAQISSFQMSKAFGSSADAMIAKAKQLTAASANYYGLEEVQYAFVKTGDSMARYGITGENYLNLVSRAMDVGAAKGLELKDSIDRIESAMRGEAEASEYLGVTLSDTYMKNMAFNGALRDSWEKLSDNEKALYRYQEFMQQSGKYTGTARDATQTFDGAIKSLANTIRTELAPALNQFARDVAPVITQLGKLASLRSVSDTMAQGAALAKSGKLEWNKFAAAGFTERQKMVDEALASQRNFAEARNREPAAPGARVPSALDTTEGRAAFWQGQGSDIDSALAKLNGQSQIDAQREIEQMTTRATRDAEAATREAQRAASDAREKDLAARETYWQQAGAQHDAALSVQQAQMELAADAELAAMEAAKDEQEQIERNYWAAVKDAQKQAGAEMVDFSQRTAEAMENNFSDLFFNAITGKLRSLSDFSAAVLSSMQRAASDYMGQIAKQAIFGSSGSGGLLSVIGQGIGSLFAPTAMSTSHALALVKHSGGTVDGSGPSRSVPSWLFAGAPRLHDGLAPDEFPAILQRGERVIPKNQANAAPAVKIQIVNQTGQQMTASQTSGPEFDGQEWVVTMWLDALNRNAHGLRDALRG